MDWKFENIYQEWEKSFQEEVVNFGAIGNFDPWGIGILCLKIIERLGKRGERIIFPEREKTRDYLRKIGFGDFLQKIGNPSSEDLKSLELRGEERCRFHRIIYSRFRDEFNARLDSEVRQMFSRFGLSKEDEQKATALVGELGNNVYDHNEGAWPTDVGGSIIIAENRPEAKRVEVGVADPGVGFLGSLKNIKKNPPSNDIEAIQLGLQGVSGRVEERRGKGLPLIQEWVTEDFRGEVRIHSGKGLVTVNRAGQKSTKVFGVLGTMAEIVIFYK